MALEDFEQLLKAAIGLDAGSIGPASVERAVQARLSACAMPDRHAYWERVRGSESELQALIEAVVVSETWFFRDREAFATLALIVLDEWRRAPADRVLRLLSLPSSTGEEPYSMAMTLVDAGMPADRFRIDAVDVSAAALALAERAVYGKNSFRGGELTFRDRHFEATPVGHRLSESVRRQVHFRHGNMFDVNFVATLAIYDVVFCRNLLIYFDRAEQDRAVAVLERLLTATGTLFVAPSETGVLMNHAFVSSRIPLAFAFRKSVVGLREPDAAQHVTRPSTRRFVAPPVAPGTVGPVRPVRPVDQATPSAAAPLPVPADEREGSLADLDDAARLADQGRFVEAAICCETHLQRHGPSANAFHLLGLVRDAGGDPADASNYYRKALYLDPEHHETLVHFAFLVEQQGNTAGAQVLRDRARRVERNRKT